MPLEEVKIFAIITEWIVSKGSVGQSQAWSMVQGQLTRTYPFATTKELSNMMKW